MKQHIDIKKTFGILLLVVLIAGFFFWRNSNQIPVQPTPQSALVHRHIKPGGPSSEGGAPSDTLSGSGK